MRLHRVPLLLLLVAAPLAAQSQHAPEAPADQRSLTAQRVKGPIRVDGRLDEGDWALAPAAGDFVQQRPHPGQAATQRTEVRVLYDDDAVYVGARMLDARPDSIAAQLARRDASGIYSDWFDVVIDSYHDRRTGFAFSVNPMGVQRDVLHSNDGEEDDSWDAVWQAATARDSSGWTAEIRIPLSQLRYTRVADGAERVWGINFVRDLARADERSYWSPVPPNYAGFVSREGELRGLAGLGGGHRLEIMPYASSKLARDPEVRGDPFYRRNAWDQSFGADVKAGLPGGLTLTGTVNPDFGQVEVDPAVVNLSAYETFYPEKRPFFVEGSDIFSFGGLKAFNSFGGPQYFYSRRIGRTPHRDLTSEFGYAEQPTQSAILGAAKVSGKTPGGWSVGLLDAVTQRETGRYVDGAGDFVRTPVEPRSNYFVGRARRDFQAGRTVVGAIGTAVNRDMSDRVFDSSVRSDAYTLGADFEHAWGNRTWTLTGFLSGSRVGGTPGVIAATQRSSARYYQRPGQTYMRLDTTRTSLAGWDGGLALQRSGSYDLSIATQQTSPGFETNDMGFESRADQRTLTTYLGRRVNTAWGPFRDHSYYGFTSQAWNFGGDRTYEQFAVGAGGTLKSLWYFEPQLRYEPATINDRLTRGGPRTVQPRAVEARLDWNSDPRTLLSGSGRFDAYERSAAGYQRSANASLALRPSASVRVSMGPSVTWVHNAAQYVLARTDAGAADTYGSRYVFADLRQTTVAMDTRVNWTFSTRVSLEMFAQPFVSTGRYRDYKELARAGSYGFDVYGRDRGTITRAVDEDGDVTYTVDPDGTGPATPFSFGESNFKVRSLRGNAVLRWEYRPGSALFFVWQQERSGDSSDPTFDGAHDFGRLFREPAHNVFLIKATYWLSR